jgi:CHAD domain-containing protein
MAYRLRRRGSIGGEVRRLVDKQLALAIAELRTVGDPRSDDAVHDARRHVKKVRALLRLVHPALGAPYRAANRRMRLANRMLAPIADAESVIDSLARLKKKYGTTLTGRTLTPIHSALVERSQRIDRKATLDRVLRKTTHLLRAERARVGGLTLDAHGVHAIAPGLERSYRRARKTMARVILEPSTENYHVWRQRVKDLWFQIRLIEGRCGKRLRREERRLEALDGCLGECHNVDLLERVVMNEALVSRRQAARCLRLLRRYQGELRHRAVTLGSAIFEEKPRRFARRVRLLWRSAKVTAPVSEKPWRRAA